MNNMINARLSQIYDFQYGRGNTNPDNGGIYPIYGSNGIIGGYHLYNSEDSPIIGHIGANCGAVVFGKGKHYVTYNGVICTIKEGNDSKFGYYTLLASNLRRLGYGSAQPFISYSLLNRVGIYLPNIDTQGKLGRILDAYDQLIENNNKRIKVLENIAEELYKEWFVRFRFPGFENITFKCENPIGWIYGKNHNYDNIPITWKYSEFKNIGTFVRGKNITASEMIEGEVPVISAGLEPSGYHNNFNVTGPSVTISASGANAGYLSYHQENIWAADCSYYSNEDNLWFAYNTLKFLQPVITNMQVGSAQPHVYAKNINKLTVLIPDDNIINLYEEIKLINQKNKNLIKQRDALLPRLMSGKLSVEGKEII